MTQNIQILHRDHKPNLAYVYTPPTNDQYPLLVFCGGYKSDMNGTKALYFEAQCRARGQAFLRFDYTGHGASDGKFIDGTIGAWTDDAHDVLRAVNDENMPVCLVGSSMGGWIIMRLAQIYDGDIVHMIGIAAAPDFTRDMYDTFNDAQKLILADTGKITLPSDYPDPYIITQAFFDDAAQNFVLDAPYELPCPMHLFHGKKDTVVAPQKARKIQDIFGADKVRITYSDNGAHNMSTPDELAMMDAYIVTLSARGASRII